MIIEVLLFMLHIFTADEQDRRNFKLNRIAEIQETRSLNYFHSFEVNLPRKHSPFNFLHSIYISSSFPEREFLILIRLALQFHSPAVFSYSLRY